VTDDLMRQLREFQEYADRLGTVLAEAEAGLAQQVTGCDRSGAVTITLGRDGTPESAHVEAGWLRSLPSARFTEAVVEAGQVAASSRLKQWAQYLNDNAWRTERRAGPTYPGQRNATEPETSLSPADNASPRPQQRSLESLAEDTLTALRTVDQLAASSPLAARGTGSNLSGQLTVTVGKAGLLCCTAAPRWLAQQSGAALSRALNEALADARDDLAQAAAAPSPATHLDELFADALTILAAPPPPERQR
jgi:hypothetical protein